MLENSGLAVKKGLASLPWSVRFVLFGISAVALVTMYFTNLFLMERFTTSHQNRAQLRLALYSGNLVSELQRNAIVPQLLASDPELIGALASNDFSRTSQRLLSFVDEIGAEGIILLDADGHVVAATNRSRLGENHSTSAYFIDSLKSDKTVFTTTSGNNQTVDFSYSRRITSSQMQLGVVVVEVDLAKFQSAWSGIADAVIVTGADEKIIIATEKTWLGVGEDEALRRTSAPNAIQVALEATQGWANIDVYAYLQGRAVMRQEIRVPFRDWNMVLFTTYTSVRQRVNTVLALEVMGFAMLFTLILYQVSRQTLTRALVFQQESEDLRQLNSRLQREITERQKVEKNLEVAEQTLAQSSKLAALGEMSAAVSHELNQPLAAMKTYLAGAQLLLTRKRPDEALVSFQRIDDLIDRMAAITRQLKSYARKGGEDFVSIDVRRAIAGAIDIMEPQLKSRRIRLITTQPSHEVCVLGDQLRLEQVIVNLLRNALDATSSAQIPEIEILLVGGDNATLSVRDNGEGIKDLDSLFEPFYTTKKPGDGVGLGLAISSGIVNDMGGRLTARKAEEGGAVFEVRLPALTCEK